MRKSNGKRHILYLASWYPSKLRSWEGIFIKKQAESITKEYNVSVLYITVDKKLQKFCSIETHIEKDVLTVAVYLNNKNLMLSFLINPFLYFYGMLKGLSLIKRTNSKPDLIQINVVDRIAVAALFFHVFGKTPYVISEHSSEYIKYQDYDTYRKNISALNYAFKKYVFSRASVIIGVSEYLINNIRKKYIVDNNYQVVPNIVSFFPQIAERSSHIFKAAIIAVLGSKDKNIDKIILAAAAPSLKDIEFHIFGDGSLRKYYEDLALENEVLNKTVFFEGYVPNDKLFDMLKNLNSFILCSKYETFSIVTAEALACGVPVIISKCGGPEEFVTEDNGIILNDCEPETIAAAIETIKHRSYNFLQIQREIKNKFSSEAVADKLTSIYNTILNERTDGI